MIAKAIIIWCGLARIWLNKDVKIFKSLNTLPACPYSVININLASSCNIGTQLEALEIHFGFDIDFFHDFDHSSQNHLSKMPCHQSRTDGRTVSVAVIGSLLTPALLTAQIV